LNFEVARFEIDLSTAFHRAAKISVGSESGTEQLCVGLLAYPARCNYLRDAPRALAISLEVNFQPGVIMKK